MYRLPRRHVPTCAGYLYPRVWADLSYTRSSWGAECEYVLVLREVLGHHDDVVMRPEVAAENERPD